MPRVAKPGNCPVTASDSGSGGSPRRGGGARRGGRPPPPPAITDVLDHAGQPAVPRERGSGDIVRGQEPALDRLPAKAREGDVGNVDGRKAGVAGLESRRQRVRSSVAERLRPEGIEVGGLVAVRLVDL